MKSLPLLASAAILLSALSCCSQRPEIAGLSGPYLDQDPPGEIPEVFAPGIISTGNHEFWISISPDGEEIFYTMRAGLLGEGFNVILCTTKKDSRWSEPFVAPFSGRYCDKETYVCAGGNRIVFNSERPKSEGSEPEASEDIWYTERIGDGWTEPALLTDVDLGERRMSPCITRSGNLYFSGNFADAVSFPDIYVSRFLESGYSRPEKLGDGVNSEHYEGHVFVPVDEDFILFDSVRPGGYGGADIYVSFRLDDGSFSQAVNLGETINSSDNDSSPFVTFDGEYFFFFSDRSDVPNHTEQRLEYAQIAEIMHRPRNGYGDIYWVDAKIIEDLRPKSN